jgi:putative Holliday junction resolvase
LKRSGIAVTDPLQIVVNGLDTVETPNLRDFLSSYLQSEDVEKVVIGLPVHTDGSYTSLKEHIDALATFIKQSNPDTHIDFEDESFTSMKAKEVIFQSGVRKKKRRDKKLVDKISAVLILQKYLKHI